MDYRRIAVRAVVTFAQVFLSVVIAGGIADWSPSTLATAAAAAVGAGLSVIYNALTQWLETTPDH